MTACKSTPVVTLALSSSSNIPVIESGRMWLGALIERGGNIDVTEGNIGIRGLDPKVLGC